MDATVADLCRIIDNNAELAAARREREIERLGLPIDASDDEIEEALARNAELRHGVG